MWSEATGVFGSVSSFDPFKDTGMRLFDPLVKVRPVPRIIICFKCFILLSHWIGCRED